jgi:EmrB/QacA subfamily drug resistance transporter
MSGDDEGAAPDRSRWVALGAVSAGVVVVTLDTTILNVAIPTIRRDLGTDLVSLVWVVTGYSLTLGSLLVIGGRLGDVFGARRTFVAGALVFAAGSVVASAATSVWMLGLGESVVEGIGAALLLPAALAALSTLFRDRERAKAFAVWGGAAGAASALGPVIGGWLATDASWRWGFRINVVVAPLAALLAARVLPRAQPRARARLDLAGAALVAAGLFLLVFTVTEAATYGWFRDLRAVGIGGVTVWPASAPVSPVPVAAVLSVVLLACFVVVERREEATHRLPLVELSLLRLRSFRFGLSTAAAVVMAQSGVLFVLAVYLQTTHRLSPADAGTWLLPVGIAVAVGAQGGGWIAGRAGPGLVVRLGIAVELVGVVAIARVIDPHATFAALAPMLVVFGIGAGLANSQLTNVILSEIPPTRAGSASGVATTNNSIAAAFGVALAGSILSSTFGDLESARSALVASAVVLAAGVVTSFAVPSARPAPPSGASGPVRGHEAAQRRGGPVP